MLIQPYHIDWPRQFYDLQSIVASSLQHLRFRIEHIGSTAVPGLAAKPIIDLDIIHQHNNDFELIKRRLEETGYYHNGDQGIPEREVFKRKPGSNHPVLDQIPHHLYVCPIHSKALERHLLLRDHLRKNEVARKEYQQMKYAIAEKAGQNKKIYAAIKEQEINTMIDRFIDDEKAAGGRIADL